MSMMRSEIPTMGGDESYVEEQDAGKQECRAVEPELPAALDGLRNAEHRTLSGVQRYE
jgi:hypothetical protein